MSKKNILVIGDVHHKISRVEKALSGWKGRVIFIGDYFDDFNDSPFESSLMAEWLKESLKDPLRIHLCGNHDLSYMALPYKYSCSGFTISKYNIINQILTREDWNKISFFHDENDFWFSHAGIKRFWFSDPILGINAEIIKNKIKKATEDILLGPSEENKCIWASDFHRGGRFKDGGLLWAHYSDVEFYEGITQIIGHTYCKKIEFLDDDGGKCINVDTNMNQVLEITEDKQFIVHDL